MIEYAVYGGCALAGFVAGWGLSRARGDLRIKKGELVERVAFRPTAEVADYMGTMFSAWLREAHVARSVKRAMKRREKLLRRRLQ